MDVWLETPPVIQQVQGQIWPPRERIQILPTNQMGAGFQFEGLASIEVCAHKTV